MTLGKIHKDLQLHFDFNTTDILTTDIIRINPIIVKYVSQAQGKGVFGRVH